MTTNRQALEALFTLEEDPTNFAALETLRDFVKNAPPDPETHLEMLGRKLYEAWGVYVKGHFLKWSEVSPEEAQAYKNVAVAVVKAHISSINLSAAFDRAADALGIVFDKRIKEATIHECMHELHKGLIKKPASKVRDKPNHPATQHIINEDLRRD